MGRRFENLTDKFPIPVCEVCHRERTMTYNNVCNYCSAKMRKGIREGRVDANTMESVNRGEISKLDHAWRMSVNQDEKYKGARS